MSEKVYLWLRILVVFLGLAAPALIFKNYSNQLRLLEQEARDRDTHLPARIEAGCAMADTFLVNHLKAGSSLISRNADGLFSSNPPDFKAFLSFPGKGSPRERYLELLHSSNRFPSGAAHGPAGALALLQQGNPLPPKDLDRLITVLEGIWRGQDYSEDQLAYLLSSLPGTLKNAFHNHLMYLGSAVSEEAVLVKIRDSQVTNLHQLSPEDLSQLNTALRGLGLGLVLKPDPSWAPLGDKVTATLAWESISQRTNKKQALTTAVLFFLIFECTLLFLFLALNRYARSAALQSQLLAVATHELRTPLAVMRQFGEILSNSRGLSEKQQLYVRHIRGAAYTMQGLVENLLKVSHMEKFDATPNLRTYPLTLWLDQACEGLKLTASHQLRVAPCPEIEVRWDGEQMERVLANLVGNGFHHGDSDVEVEVAMDRGKLLLEVRDFGEKTDKLPEPGKFKRGSHHRAGLGLGLYLCDRVVKAHGGRMTFSKAHPGLRVQVELPMEETS